jgi:hypothetical protein
MTTIMGLRQAAPFDTLLHFVPQLLRMLKTPQMWKVVLSPILRSEGVAMKLEQFLVKAKINAYASQGEGGEGILTGVPGCACRSASRKRSPFPRSGSQESRRFA